MARRIHDGGAPQAIRGGALGFLWNIGYWADGASAQAQAVTSLRGAARPETLGDFLAGLFATAREEVLSAPDLCAAIDALFGEASEADFLLALPSLRLAFGYFPPLERERIARLVLGLHGLGGALAPELLRDDAEPSEVVRGHDLDAKVAAIVRRYGLAPRENSGGDDA
jgi:hypothetical protein